MIASTTSTKIHRCASCKTEWACESEKRGRECILPTTLMACQRCLRAGEIYQAN